MLKDSIFSITNKSLLARPKLTSKGGIFQLLKKEILGDKYELSLVFITAEEILKLNKIYRHINKATDILSFPLTKNSGEIFICPSETRKMMSKFGRTYENFLVFLFIHGLIHLKGYDHGDKMEKIEEKFRKKFKI
jgi:probable rRNA maturation factor